MTAYGLKQINHRIEGTFKAYSDLFFVNDTFFGILVFLATFINLNIAIAGIWGMLSIHIFDILIGDKTNLLDKRFLIYNALLVSLGIGFIFKINIPVLVIVSLLSISTLFLSIAIDSILKKYYLPALSIPFCFIILMVFFASKNYSNLPFIINHDYLFSLDLLKQNKVISLLLKSIGAVVFIPNEVVGLIILMGQFFKSRMIFLIVILGFAFGVTIEQYLTPIDWSEVSLIYAYNFVLISLALGTVFMLPTFKSLIILPFALFFGIIINDSLLSIFQSHQIPVFTVAFNVTTLIYLYALRAIDYKNFPMVIGKTPEDSLDQALLTNKRKENQIRLNLPFPNSMHVYQGFDGKWTHVGDWKYAVDFVAKDEEMKSYKHNELLLEDYYCFGMPVNAPISGTIVTKQMELFDNEIGCVDTENNWGNYLMIYSDAGYYVLICHLKQHSSLLEVGQRVIVGQTIALCGNSGYSPEPHLHIQVQYSAVLGDKTLPFVFDEYIIQNELKLNTIPEVGENVKNISNRLLGHILPYTLDKHFVYDWENKVTGIKRTYTISVELDQLSGRLFLVDKNRNKLYIKRKANSILFESFEGNAGTPLAFLASVLPEIPYHFARDLQWNTYIPNKVSLSSLSFSLKSLFSFFLFRIGHQKSVMKFKSSMDHIVFKSYFNGSSVKGGARLSASGDIDLIETEQFLLKRLV